MTWPDNDFLGYDPPPVTVYTGMSSRNYILCFSMMLIIHILALMFMKGKVSPDFRKLNLLDRLLHSAVSTNFPFAVNDWDLKKTDQFEEYYESMTNNRLEVVLNIMINLVFNLFLLTPMEHLCKYNRFIHIFKKSSLRYQLWLFSSLHKSETVLTYKLVRLFLQVH